MGRQQLIKKQALGILEDSDEEEREMLEERESEKNDHLLPAKQGEFMESTPDASTHAIPALNMDSDTDSEGEEQEVASAGHVSLNTNQVSQPPNTDHFHLDSDTDIDEDEDAFEKVAKAVLSSGDGTKPPNVSVIQPEGVTVDSDTDVDDNDAVSDAATKAKPMSFQSAHTADTAYSTQLKDFNLDSDTDVDDEEEIKCGKDIPISKIDAFHTRLDINSVGSEHVERDTDDEAIPAISECPVVFAESCSTADTVAELDILPDSDTDVEEDSHLVIPVVVKTLPTPPADKSEALQSDSDADTDLDESRVPPVGDVDSPADLRADSHGDEENTEADIPETDEGQIPDLCREETPGMLLPLLQNCSTPVQISGN